MRKLFAFAGLEFEVNLPDDAEFDHDRTLMPFRCNEVLAPHRFYFELVEQLTAPQGACIATEPALRVYAFPGGTLRYNGAVSHSWEDGHIRVEHRGKDHFVQLKASAFSTGFGGKTVLNSLAAEHLVARNMGFVFHSSFVEYEGKGILFTAPSGTGKSTQAALWEKHRAAEIINGDRSAVCVKDGNVVACGIPFAGSSNICKNKTLPLGAVVYLKQAPQNKIRRLVGAEAFCRIWEGCSVNTWDKEDVSAISETVQQVVSHVPIFELACTPDEAAVITLEEVLKQKGIL